MSEQDKYIIIAPWRVKTDEYDNEVLTEEAMKKLNDAIREWAATPEVRAKLRQSIEQTNAISMSIGYKWPIEGDVS